MSLTAAQWSIAFNGFYLNDKYANTSSSLETGVLDIGYQYITVPSKQLEALINTIKSNNKTCSLINSRY